jgi:hypothetical protein
MIISRKQEARVWLFGISLLDRHFYLYRLSTTPTPLLILRAEDSRHPDPLQFIVCSENLFPR